MLELPEAHTLSLQISQLLAGKQIAGVTAAASPHRFAFFTHEPEVYRERLRGKTLVGANPVAGQVEVEAEDQQLVFNDGANLRYHRPGDKLPAKHQLLVEFSDGSHLSCTVSMYAGISLMQGRDTDNGYYLGSRSKPSPLTDAFDRPYFDGLLESAPPRLSAKAFLATEQRIPGLGNGVLQDILFRAGIHPKSAVGKLGADTVDRLYSSLKGTLRSMADQGGRDTEKTLLGESGGYRTLLSNKTLELPCPECGGAIMRQAYLGGNVYFCPTCQPVLR